MDVAAQMLSGLKYITHCNVKLEKSINELATSEFDNRLYASLQVIGWFSLLAVGRIAVSTSDVPLPYT